jgi:Putative zinc- or iron-chelating domain
VSRSVHARYDDPLDLVWLACARELGIRVARSPEVYASFDGAHTLTLSTPEGFDPDDSLAQLIFHELCHGLVAGPRHGRSIDWGMENVDERDLVVEQACHRLQARLADDYGLRGLLAVTTDHRPYWDALPIDPLAPSDDPALPLAREAYGRAKRGPWAPALERALMRTRAIADVVRSAAEQAPPEPLKRLWAETRALHASGFPVGDTDAQCGSCAWAGGSGARRRCLQSGEGPRTRRVAETARACVRYEPRLSEDDCGGCGACCREAFDRVELRPKDPVRARHPALVTVDGFGPHLGRPGGRCVALTGGTADAPYRCTIYADRPRSCADFAVNGAACLTARRRVGLSA